MKCIDCRYYKPISFSSQGECLSPTPFWVHDRGVVKPEEDHVNCKAYMPPLIEHPKYV